MPNIPVQAIYWLAGVHIDELPIDRHWNAGLRLGDIATNELCGAMSVLSTIETVPKPLTSGDVCGKDQD